ncbi:hypothetical protein A1O1_00933 [Capronia coronata CBS 617.96]|uniref:RBR-type E3 ubiquitin transferase n=1 Tax=Capronia coronata CBS 617.96 TaxID=1182541 RepID=W9ZMU2_9EURO|nr:uncharacterized protein A1O1_00933 [Capronia coronata CBS 617.96]EXJ95809.1 hypothetical protein A1O1_00933 [Capronia coronata CBS 617.96]
MAEEHSPFEYPDRETVELLLNLQLEDVQDLRNHSKDKNHGEDLNDSQLALSFLEQDLECIRSIISDRFLAQSVAQAVQSDGPLIANVVREEEVACEDHTLAHRMNGCNVTSEVNLQSSLDEEILSKLAGQYVSEDAGRELCTDLQVGKGSVSDIACRAESSTRASSRDDHATSHELVCVACRETKKYLDIIEAACGHGYCKPCLQELFDLSTKDESLFPPRCCREPLDLSEVQIFLTKELKDKFERAKVEFSTVDKTYCSEATCSAFIPVDANAGDAVFCWECGTETCVTCKAGAHIGDCPDDTALRETLALATASGWQRCLSCRRLIELEVGCNHMT